LEISVRKISSVLENLGHRVVPVLKGHVGAKKAIISEMNCAGKREVCTRFNVLIKILIH
jgi:hypothetical protein